MGKEIERKFLVRNNDYKQQSVDILCRQGYLCVEPERTVRVRVNNYKGFITVKGKTVGATRLEYEYEIPLGDANEILDILCEKPIIEKHRYRCQYMGFTWDVDEFHGENEGLIIAEIELETEDAGFEKPEWVGEEVTNDPRYYNSNLVKNPYTAWQ